MGTPRVVVLDTNVLISALGWRGPEHSIYQLCRTGVLQAATSPQLLAELERVLGYPKFGLVDKEIRQLVSEFRARASVVRPSERIEIIQQDPSDNLVLECAVRAKADWIVSGDAHLLDLRVFRSIRVLGARSVLVALERE